MATLRSSLVAFLFIPVGASAQPGFLDPTFDSDGLVRTDVGLATFDEAHALTIQPNGAIVAAGTSGYAGTQDFAVVRYLDDGSPDPSFGAGGRAVVSVDFGDDIARAVALQPDGKILVGGYSYTSLGIGFALMRLHVDGSPDSTFGANGIVTTITPGDLTLQARALLVQADGRIVLAGGGSAGFAITRYLDNGQPDTTFGTAGLVTIGFSGGNDQATAVALRPDGRILLVGYASGLVADSIAIAQLMPDGSLDPAFTGGGAFRTTYPTLPSIALGLDLMNDGRFVVCGYANSSSVVGRFLADGSIDASFNVFGWRMLSFAGFVSSKLHDAHVQGDGRIALGGIGYGAHAQFLIVNLNSDGSFDTGFGTGGYTWSDFSSDLDEAFALAAQTDGKLVLAGRTNGGISDLDFALTRYMPDLNVGVVEVREASALHVFPSPAADVVNVWIDPPMAGGTLEVIDARGAVMHARRMAGDRAVIDAGAWPVGVYQVRVLDTDWGVARACFFR